MIPDLKITKSAGDKILELIELEEDPSLKLRIYIVGGGCSGFEYGFSFDKKINEDDLIVNYNNKEIIKELIVVDSMSLTLLKGATVDYTTDLQGSRFKIVNPNAKTTCGCGSSFSV